MKWLLPFVLLVCAGASTSRAQEAADLDAASKIIALENSWNRAAQAKDLHAMDTLLDDAFVYVDANGKLLSKAGVMADVKASHRFQASLESMVVHLHGETAVVTGIYQIRSADSRNPSVRRDRFVDTWRRKNGQWISIASLATPIGS